MKLQLQRLRKLAGLGQKEMAEALGIKIRTYGSWERGEVDISFPQACKVADVLGCTTDELAGRTAPKVYTDPNQEALNGYYESMNDNGKNALVESARLMSGNPETRIKKDGPEDLPLHTAMGA